MSRILHLPVKAVYFHQIKAGTKPFEYRLVTDHWRKRIEGKEFDEVHIKLGYPKAGDRSRTLIRPWRGYERQTITHPHFGPDPVEVFAVRVNGIFAMERPMSEFKRERRYLVAKVRDVEAALSDDEKRQLSALMDKVEHHREQQGKPPLECVVVESDWPNYQETWDSVQKVWEGQ